MSQYRDNRVRIWTVGVRQRSKRFQPTSLRWFSTRKECQDYIDDFRSKSSWYSNMEYKPMCYYPSGHRSKP